MLLQKQVDALSMVAAFSYIPAYTSHTVVEEYLNQNKEIAKRIFRFKREKLIKILWETKLPINYDNIVYVVNFFEAKDATIQKLTPKIVLKKLEKCREDAEN